jgi:hypothetical protein
MHARHVDRVDRAASRDRLRSHDTSHETRLEAVLREDLSSVGANLGVVVTRGCGAVDVRVLGPAATLTLAFDTQEAQSAHVRMAVRRAIARYASSLKAASRLLESEGEGC